MPEDLPRLIKVLPAEYREYVLVRALTGLTASEGHGLRWKHVDLEGRVIDVVEQMSRGKKSQVRTQRHRSVPIGQAVVDALRVLQSRRKTPHDGEALVFVSPRGRAMNTNNFSNRVWLKLSEENDFLNGTSPRDLRYTAVIAFLREGRPVEEVIKIMGYATVDVVMRLFNQFGRPPEIVYEYQGCVTRRVSSDVNIDPTPPIGKPRRVISTFQKDAILQLPVEDAVAQTGFTESTVKHLRHRFGPKRRTGRRPRALTAEQREMLTYMTISEFVQATGLGPKTAEGARKRLGITGASLRARRAERAAAATATASQTPSNGRGEAAGD